MQQGVFNRIRKSLGYQKWYRLQGGKELLRYQNWSNADWQAFLSQLENKAHQTVTNLVALPVPRHAEAEVHTLCGHGHVDMALLSLHSFTLFTDATFPIYIHSDGSLTPDDEALFQKYFPGVHVIHRKEVIKLVEDRLSAARFERLREFAFSCVHGPKLLDSHLVGTASTILLLDTDVLWFQKPSELISGVGKPTWVFIPDMTDSFSAPVPELVNKLQHAVIPRFNSGVVLLPRLDIKDFELADELLGRFEPAWLRHCWVEQTIYSAVAGERDYRVLPASYHIGGKTKGAVAVHYTSVRSIRARYFTEGLARLSHVFQAQPTKTERESGIKEAVPSAG